MNGCPVVLVIEDSSELRQELRNVMTNILGLEVAEGGGVRAVVESFTAGPRPDLALVNLDGVTGAEAVESLKRAHADVPVIGMSVEDCRDKAKQLGCDDLLLKPFLLEELADVVSRWLPAGH